MQGHAQRPEGNQPYAARTPVAVGRQRPTTLGADPRDALQAGVLLFLCRHADDRLTDIVAAMRVKLPTFVVVVQDLVQTFWVIKRHSVQDRCAPYVCDHGEGQEIARKRSRLRFDK